MLRLASQTGGCVLEGRREMRRQVVSVQDGGASLQRRRDSLFERHFCLVGLLLLSLERQRLDDARRDSHKTAKVRGTKECKESVNQQAKGTRINNIQAAQQLYSFSLVVVVVVRSTNKQNKTKPVVVILWEQGRKAGDMQDGGVLKTRMQNKFRSCFSLIHTPGTCLCFKTLLRLASQPPAFRLA